MERYFDVAADRLLDEFSFLFQTFEILCNVFFLPC